MCSRTNCPHYSGVEMRCVCERTVSCHIHCTSGAIAAPGKHIYSRECRRALVDLSGDFHVPIDIHCTIRTLGLGCSYLYSFLSTICGAPIPNESAWEELKLSPFKQVVGPFVRFVGKRHNCDNLFGRVLTWFGFMANRNFVSFLSCFPME